MSRRGGPYVVAQGLVKRYTGREGTVEAVRGVGSGVRALDAGVDRALCW